MGCCKLRKLRDDEGKDTVAAAKCFPAISRPSSVITGKKGIASILETLASAALCHYQKTTQMFTATHAYCGS